MAWHWVELQTNDSLALVTRKNWADYNLILTWLWLERLVIISVRKNFSRGQHRHFAYTFQAAEYAIDMSSEGFFPGDNYLSFFEIRRKISHFYIQGEVKAPTIHFFWRSCKRIITKRSTLSTPQTKYPELRKQSQKCALLAAIARHITVIYAMQIFKARHFFTKKHCLEF